MAVSRSENVYIMTADKDTIAGVKLNIVGIKFDDTSTSTNEAQLKHTDTNGSILWQGTVAGDGEIYNQVNLTIGIDTTLHLDLTGAGTVWLYLE